MIPYSCSARCWPGATLALLSRVRPLHSLEELEAERALTRELLEERTLASDRTASALPSELTPGAPGDLHFLLPCQHGLFIGLGGGFRAGFRPVLYLNLDESCLTHHLLPLDQQVGPQSEALDEHLARGLGHVRAPGQL